MSIPFNIAMPKFNIDNRSRDIHLSFSTFPKINVPQVTTVIDCWSITDHRGRCVHDVPIGNNSYITAKQHGKKIELVMRGVGFQLSYDSLDICIHFLNQDGKSFEAHYSYKMIGNKFSFVRIVEATMSDDEKDLMFDILVKAAEHEHNAAEAQIPRSNNQQNNNSTDCGGYTDEINEFIRATDREMRFLRGNGGRKYKIINGQFVMQSQGGYIYSFDLEAELYLAEDSPVTVTVGLDSIPGVVLVCENFQVIIALEKIPYADKSLKIPKADISAEPWKLLEKLNLRLKRINANNDIALSLLKDGPRLALKAEKSQASFDDVSDEEKVGIITPYAAQTRLIKAMIQDHRQSKKTTNISCATVHQFQGSERNVVVFDAVESCPSTRAGWLMSRNEGGSVTRLINVALTRSRGKFIAIANRTFWLNKCESNNMFYLLIKYMSTSSHILNHQQNGLANYIAANDFGNNIRVYTSTITSNADVLGDIRSAKDKIVLMIPKGRINSEYAKTILDEIYKQKNNKVSVVIIYDKSVVVPPEYEDICIPSDKVTMPLLFIDNKAWYGLPIYQHFHSEAKVMYPILTDILVRFSGKCTVEMIRSLVEHTNVRPPVASGLGLFVRKNCHCDQCGESLSLIKAAKHFLKCKKCGKTQALTVQMVNRYLDSTGGRCPRCGRDMFAVNGMYGVYVKCSDNHISKLDDI